MNIEDIPLVYWIWGVNAIIWVSAAYLFIRGRIEHHHNLERDEIHRGYDRRFKEIEAEHKREIIKLKMKPEEKLLNDLELGSIFRVGTNIYQLIDNLGSSRNVIRYVEVKGNLKFDSIQYMMSDTIVKQVVVQMKEV